MMGGVPLSYNMGDHSQLPPVMDIACFLPLGSNDTSPVRLMGVKLYQTHKKKIYLLNQPVRQKVGEFNDSLKHLRSGVDVIDDLQLWASRRVHLLPNDERNLFAITNNETIEATGYNNVRDSINVRYISTFKNIRVVKSINVGCHAIGEFDDLKKGMLKKLPRRGFYAKDMMIKLTSNICTALNLTNNTRGIIKDILYRDTDGSYKGYVKNTTLDNIILMIHIPSWKGVQINANMKLNYQDNWIPIAAITLSCDKFCCKRTMLPVTVAKADSCYCLQGLTAGDKQMIKRVLLHWSVAQEGLWPNLFYVGASRAEEKHNFALENDISGSDLMKIGNYPSVLKQQNELADLATKAMEFRLEINATKIAFKHEIQWFIDTIRDRLQLIPETENLRKEITIHCLEQWQKSLDDVIYD
jgi:hypothetical protein